MFSKRDRREETGFCRRLSAIRTVPGLRRQEGRGCPFGHWSRGPGFQDSRWRFHQALLPLEEPPWRAKGCFQKRCGKEEVDSDFNGNGNGAGDGDGDGGACGRGRGRGSGLVVVGVGRGLWTRALSLGAPITPRLSSDLQETCTCEEGQAAWLFVVFAVTVQEGKRGLSAPGALGRLDLSRREYRYHSVY